MSTLKFALGIACSGVLAFGLVLTAHALTAPVFGPPSASSTGTEETPAEDAHDENTLADGSGPENEGSAQPIDMAILGRWQAPKPANQEAFVVFSDDDTWKASDGCNGASSTWEVDTKGTFMGGEPGPMTLIACNNVNIPTAIWGAIHAEVTSDHELILTDTAGEEFVLVRSAQQPE
ncbi:heat shock protein HslJ [Leucobacter exalbidus]|uniref:Heat shock protein HslJ n=1 Tax=Leucobacter exalbidus TaxID=662960 RepID=A0A940PVR3_9MICO|nr:hypothetical protein [Leucobacter exalbidus]MBP1327125.1 heat shock protein HslJ [Leucobacter exalbidus]